MPTAEPEELVQAILDCIDAGAHVVNLSAALAQPTTKGERTVEAALDYAAKRGVVVIVAAGNQGDAWEYRYYPPSVGPPRGGLQSTR